MPLFDYHCDFCDETIEHIINSNDPEPTCKYCQGKLTRLLSPPAEFTGERIKTVNAKLDRIGAGKYKD